MAMTAARRRDTGFTLVEVMSATVLMTVGLMGLGVVCGLGALTEGAGAAGGTAATLAILGGGLFLGLRLQSGQDARVPAVKVGEPILEFSALDDRGEPFHLSSMRGEPYLLKFFRGHW